ncbi:IclR family transcriptional regulator [Natronosalvus rutilus]|uniref:Helix-turn-helix domain-containing protein n=1 Tax=Natronosalvus rutilus TaxID=2953753 RepID=A0A9E7SUQ6_9EURY|nr:helix-turn-helix domain-containing protein [Natronosalvus rutilus]UTF52226.1 helix-turn-helix domain-containing protein [Natronosalvus rutilus]
MSQDSVRQQSSSWVKSTKTVFDIVETLRERDGAGVTQIAQAIDLSKSAVHKHLQTLRSLGYVTKDGTEYRLGLSFLSLGTYTMERKLFEFGDATNDIDSLAENTRMPALLVVPDGTDGVVLYQVSGTQDPRFRNGERFFLPTKASGVSILAHLPKERRKMVLSQLEEERREEINSLQQARDQRVVYKKDVENQQQSVAAPVLDSNEMPVGAIAVSGALGNISDKRLHEDVTGLVLSTANSVQGNLTSEHQERPSDTV